MEILYLTLKWNTNLCKYLLIILRERKAKIHRICKNQISKWKITRKMYKFKYPVQYQMEISCYQLSIHPWISGVIKANISSQKSSPINEWKLRKLCIKKIQFLVDTKHYSFIEMYLHLYIYNICPPGLDQTGKKLHNEDQRDKRVCFQFIMHTWWSDFELKYLIIQSHFVRKSCHRSRSYLVDYFI